MFILVLIGILGVITLVFLFVGGALSIFHAIFGGDDLKEELQIREMEDSTRRYLHDMIDRADNLGKRHNEDHRSIYLTDARSIHNHNHYNDYDDDSDRYIDY
jgi:hypothetical protein